MKKSIFIILLVFNSILTLAMLFFFGIIRTYIDMYLPLGALLVFPMFIIIVYFCEFILLSVGISHLVPKLKFRCFFSTAISLILLATIILIPCTNAFGVANYKMNYDLRLEFVESLSSNLNDYPQVDMSTYFVEDTRLSYTGTVMVDMKEESTKVMFDIYWGIGMKTVLIYSSNGELAKTDFDGEYPYGYFVGFKSIKKLDDNWWLAFR